MTASETPVGSEAARLLHRRILADTPGIAQLWFSATVLDRYLQGSGFKVMRTNTVGRLRGPQWTLDFGIVGEGDALIHLCATDAGHIPPADRDHWAAHVAALPLSANYVLMQLSRGACIDDGDVRAW